MGDKRKKQGGSSILRGLVSRGIGEYLFDQVKYSPSDDLMPVYNGSMAFGKPIGYADCNANIRIPFHEEWEWADRFDEGLALVRRTDGRYAAINRAGDELFYMPVYNSEGYYNHFQRLYQEKDMFGYYLEGNSNPYIREEDESFRLLVYDRSGCLAVDQVFPFARMGSFHAGFAPVYQVDWSRSKEKKPELFGYPTCKKTYVQAGFIDLSGAFWEKLPASVSPQIIEEPGFSFSIHPDRGDYQIYNPSGNAIASVSRQAVYTRPMIPVGRNFVLLPRQEENARYWILTDAAGQTYPAYCFEDLDGYNGRIAENTFIARPYCSPAEKRTYIERLTDPVERAVYQTGGYGRVIPALQPLTIYKILERTASPTDSGRWRRSGGRTFFRCTDGSFPKQWAFVQGHWYYFGENGERYTGWLIWENRQYYLQQDGKMAADTWADGRYLGPEGICRKDGTIEQTV